LVNSRIKAGRIKYEKFERQKLVEMALQEHDINMTLLNKYKEEIERINSLKAETQKSLKIKADRRIKMNDNLVK